MTTPTTSTTTERRARWRPGFRLRVFGLLAALLIGAVGAGFVIERAVLNARLDREVERDHEQERTEVAALAAGRDPRTGTPFGADVEAVLTTFLDRNVPSDGEAYFAFVDGELIGASPTPLPLDRLTGLTDVWAGLDAGARGTDASPAGDVRWLASPLRHDGRTAGVFVVATFLATPRAEVDATVRTQAAVSALVLVVALAVAWSLAGRLLRPVREVTANARSIDERDLSTRIPVRGDDEIAQLARTYNAMLDRLEAAFATQRRFVDDAGHELRTPITVVQGHLELMGDDPDERRETIALVTDELDRMARMVGDLLMLAKAEQPTFLHPEPVDVVDLTQGLLHRSRALADRTWTVDAVASGRVVADEDRLTQAVLNLVRNAVEHTELGDELALGSAIVDGELRLWVRDTGPGVPAEDRDHLFERFARGSASRRRADGAGLGLAIVKAIADAHGGRVEVADAAPHGALFTIVVPGATTPPPVPPPPPPVGPDDPTVPFPGTGPARPLPGPEEATWPAS